MIEELIKMYEEYKKAAIEREELDVAEYYSQTIVNLKQRKLNQEHPSKESSGSNILHTTSKPARNSNK